MSASVTYHANAESTVRLKESPDTGTRWLEIGDPQSNVVVFGGAFASEKLAFVGQLKEAVDAWYAQLTNELVQAAVGASRARH